MPECYGYSGGLTPGSEDCKRLFKILCQTKNTTMTQNFEQPRGF